MKRPAAAACAAGNQVARAFGADAGILRIGGNHARLIELARQIGELMDDDAGLGGADRRGDRLRVENIEHGRDHPCPRKLACGLGRARRAGDVVPGAQEKRHQPSADGAAGAREEYSHRPMLGRRAASGRDTSMPKLLRRSFFARSVHAVAPDLIGATLLFKGVGGVIVEVEAYHHTDPAAHSFGGQTERNSVMFGPPGYAYVYRSYGVHWCLNFVCEPQGSASAVLIRALAPTQGLPAMRRRRGIADERLLCSGPGRLCQALGITGTQYGLALDAPPFELRARSQDVAVAIGPRIGLSKAVDHPWRYGLKDSRFVSKPFKG